MISPADARVRLHAMIDDMPDDQIALVWMTFQSMFGADLEDDEDDDDELDELDRF